MTKISENEMRKRGREHRKKLVVMKRGLLEFVKRASKAGAAVEAVQALPKIAGSLLLIDDWQIPEYAEQLEKIEDFKSDLLEFAIRASGESATAEEVRALPAVVAVLFKMAKEEIY